MSSKNGSKNAQPGVNRVRKVLADGTVKFYDYTRRGARVTIANRDTLASLMRRFEASDYFRNLAVTTKKEYARMFRVIDREFGTTPFEALQLDAFYDEVLTWRDEMAARAPAHAWHLAATLASVLSWGVKRRILARNILVGMPTCYRSDRSDMIWTDDDIKRFLAVASPRLALAMLLALSTAQRQLDLLQLRWADYDGKTIRLTQHKTGVKVVVPCTKLLRETLDGLERTGDYILSAGRGEPWKSSNFRQQWNATAKKAGIAELHFHDLRGTAITKLAEAGCSIPQIVAISGHSLSSTQILSKYVSQTDVQARRAIEMLEAHTSLPAFEKLGAPVITITHEEEDESAQSIKTTPRP